MILMTGTEAFLHGDWTLKGVTPNIDSLARSLQQLGQGSKKDLRVDCGQIQETDSSGLQLLNVWIQCLRFRGIEPTLVNVPKNLRHSMQFFIGDSM